MDAKTAPLAGGTVDLKKKDFTIVMATTNRALPAWWASTVRKILGRAAMCAHHAQQATFHPNLPMVGPRRVIDAPLASTLCQKILVVQRAPMDGRVSTRSLITGRPSSQRAEVKIGKERLLWPIFPVNLLF